MPDYPIAVLRFKWRDQADAAPTWPDFAYRGCYLPVRPKGVARYWQDCTFGLVNLEGSVLYPWKVLDLDIPRAYLDRSTVLANAIERGLDEGFPLHNFKYVVAVVIPNTQWVGPNGIPGYPVDGGAVAGLSTRGGTWSCALLSEDYSFDYIAHEVGHALGADHPWRFQSATAVDAGSPYCVMSSEYYGGEKPLWASGPDPALPAPPKYWTQLSPRPSAATLLHYFPEFATSGYVKDLGDKFATAPRSVKLHAPETGRTPIAAVVKSPTSGIRYVVEYRRARGWDKGLKPAVVVHSIDPTGTPDPSKPVIYEGRISIDHLGDLDLRSRNKEVTVILDQAADDGAAVEVTIGGATLVDQMSSAIDVREISGESWLYEEGIATVPIPPVCGSGVFRFYIDHQVSKLACTARAYGFDEPEFLWSVNGILLPLSGTFSLSPDEFKTMVTCEFPRPNGLLIEIRDASVHYEIDGNSLTLTGRPDDGNYLLNVEVSVKEKGATAAGPTAKATSAVRLVGVLVRYEETYYDAVEQCVQNLRDVAQRFAESTRLPGFSRGRGPQHGISVLRAWQREVHEQNPALATQLDQAARVLSSRQPRLSQSRE